MPRNHPAERRAAWRTSVSALLILVAVVSSFSQTQNRDSSLAKARAFAEKGDYSAAQAVLKSLLTAQPGDLEARIDLARTLSWEGRTEEADLEYDTVLLQDPLNREALFGKAQVAAWSGRSAQALALLTRLEELQPPTKATQQLQGNVHYWNGDPEEALPFYEQAYAMDSLDVEVIRSIARCHLLTSRYAEADFWYDRLLLLKADDAEAHREHRRMSFMALDEIHIGGEIEWFTPGDVPTSTIVNAEYYHQLSQTFKPFVFLGYSDRFSENDVRFGGGAYANPWSNVSLFGRALTAPGSSVLPHWDVSVDSWFVQLDPVELLLGVRAMWFESSRVFVASVGAQMDVGSGFLLFPRLYWSQATDQSSSVSASLSVFTALNNRTELRLGGYAGSESFRATWAAQVSTRTSGGVRVGIRSRLSTLFGIDGTFQYVMRKDASDSALLTAVFVLFLG